MFATGIMLLVLAMMVDRFSLVASDAVRICLDIRSDFHQIWAIGILGRRLMLLNKEGKFLDFEDYILHDEDVFFMNKGVAISVREKWPKFGKDQLYDRLEKRNARGWHVTLLMVLDHSDLNFYLPKMLDDGSNNPGLIFNTKLNRIEKKSRQSSDWNQYWLSDENDRTFWIWTKGQPPTIQKYKFQGSVIDDSEIKAAGKVMYFCRPENSQTEVILLKDRCNDARRKFEMELIAGFHARKSFYLFGTSGTGKKHKKIAILPSSAYDSPGSTFHAKIIEPEKFFDCLNPPPPNPDPHVTTTHKPTTTHEPETTTKDIPVTKTTTFNPTVTLKPTTHIPTITLKPTTHIPTIWTIKLWHWVLFIIILLSFLCICIICGMLMSRKRRKKSTNPILRPNPFSQWRFHSAGSFSSLRKLNTDRWMKKASSLRNSLSGSPRTSMLRSTRSNSTVNINLKNGSVPSPPPSPSSSTRHKQQKVSYSSTGSSKKTKKGLVVSPSSSNNPNNKDYGKVIRLRIIPSVISKPSDSTGSSSIKTKKDASIRHDYGPLSVISKPSNTGSSRGPSGGSSSSRKRTNNVTTKRTNKGSIKSSRKTTSKGTTSKGFDKGRKKVKKYKIK